MLSTTQMQPAHAVVARVLPFRAFYFVENFDIEFLILYLQSFFKRIIEEQWQTIEEAPKKVAKKTTAKKGAAKKVAKKK